MQQGDIISPVLTWNGSAFTGKIAYDWSNAGGDGNRLVEDRATLTNSGYNNSTNDVTNTISNENSNSSDLPERWELRVNEIYNNGNQRDGLHTEDYGTYALFKSDNTCEVWGEDNWGDGSSEFYMNLGHYTKIGDKIIFDILKKEGNTISGELYLKFTNNNSGGTTEINETRFIATLSI